MPLYRVDRRMGALSADDLDAAVFRSLACLPHFQGLVWLRSYHDAAAGQLTCYFEAARPDDIRQHAEMAHVPCDAVAEVTEYLPDGYR